MLAETTPRAAIPPPDEEVADAAVRAPAIMVRPQPVDGSAAPDVSLPVPGEPQAGAAPLDLVPQQPEAGHARRLGFLAAAGLIVSLALHAGAVGAFLSMKRPEPPALDLPSVEVEIVTPAAEPPPAATARATPEPDPQAPPQQETQTAEVPLPPLEQPPLPSELTPPEPRPEAEPPREVAVEPPPAEVPPLPDELTPPLTQVAAVDPATVTIDPPPTEARPLPDELKPPERPTVDASTVTIDPPPAELMPLPAELTPPPPVRDAATEVPATSPPATAPATPRRQLQAQERRARPPPPRRQARAETRQPAPQPPRPAPRAEGRPAAPASAASEGRGVSSTRSQRNSTPPPTYLSRVMAQLNRARPAGTGETGRIVVRFVIQRSGAATGIALASRSGNAGLDQAALAMVRRAAPFPPLPAEFAPSSMPLSLPINFR